MFPSSAQIISTAQLQKGLVWLTKSKHPLLHSSWDFVLLSVLADNAASPNQNFDNEFIARYSHKKIIFIPIPWSSNLDVVNKQQKTFCDSYLEVFSQPSWWIFVIPSLKLFIHGQI